MKEKIERRSGGSEAEESVRRSSNSRAIGTVDVQAIATESYRFLERVLMVLEGREIEREGSKDDDFEVGSKSEGGYGDGLWHSEFCIRLT